MPGMADVLERIADAAEDLSPAWPEAGRVWADREVDVFATESSGRWTPLRLSTLLRKRRAGIVPDTLVETGTLRRALTSAVPRAEGPTFAVFGPPKGAPIAYIEHHLRGRGVPQRNPVPKLSNAERDRMVEILREHLRIGR